MKFLILTSEFDPYRGGIGTYAREMAKACAQLGHEVLLVAPDYHKDESQNDRAYPFEVMRYRGGQHSTRDIPSKVMLVRSLASRRDFDVVHAADWPFYLPVAVSRFRRRARGFVTFHGTEINFMRDAKRSILLDLTRFWNGWATYVANSRFTAAHLRKTFPQVAAEHVLPVGLGVGANWQEVAISREEARAAAGLAPERFAIASLGRVVRRKGHLVLAAALKRLPPEVQKLIDWYVIGPQIDADYLAELKAAIAPLGVRTTLAGALPDAEVKRLLRAADLFCLPGFWDNAGQFEGFGLVYLEAGALGVPSVATDVGGVPDAVQHGVTGLLVKPNDEAAIAAAIETLYRDPDYRRRLGEGARAAAQAATWTHVARQTYGL